MLTNSKNLVMVPIGKIYIDRDANVSRPVIDSDVPIVWNEQNAHLFKDIKDCCVLAKSQATGYIVQDGIIILDAIPTEYIPEMMAELQKTWDRLKDNTMDIPVTMQNVKIVVSASDFLRVWERDHLEQDGSLMIPEYRPVNGCRRCASGPLANAIAFVGNAQGLPVYLEGVEKYPCMVKEYNTVSERMQDSIIENTLKYTGTRPVSDQGLVEAAVKLYREPGCKQSTFRHIFKDGVGQKLWWYCALNAKHEELELFENMAKAAKIYTTAGGSYRPFKDAHDGDLKAARAFVQNPAKDKKNSPKVASGVDLEGVITQCSCKTIATILQAARDNNLGDLSWLIQNRKAVKELDAVFVKLMNERNTKARSK